MKNHDNECGPVIACGAAYVEFDHKPGDPTSIDKAVAAIKRLFSGNRESASARRSSQMTNAHSGSRA